VKFQNRDSPEAPGVGRIQRSRTKNVNRDQIGGAGILQHGRAQLRRQLAGKPLLSDDRMRGKTTELRRTSTGLTQRDDAFSSAWNCERSSR